MLTMEVALKVEALETRDGLLLFSQAVAAILVTSRNDIQTTPAKPTVNRQQHQPMMPTTTTTSANALLESQDPCSLLTPPEYHGTYLYGMVTREENLTLSETNN